MQEMIYAICVMVIGKLLFGFILGSIASTLANLDTQRVLFEEKFIALKVAMYENYNHHKFAVAYPGFEGGRC